MEQADESKSDEDQIFDNNCSSDQSIKDNRTILLSETICAKVFDRFKDNKPVLFRFDERNILFVFCVDTEEFGALPVYLDVPSNEERKGFNGVLCSCDTLRYLDDDYLVQDDYIKAIHKSLFQ